MGLQLYRRDCNYIGGTAVMEEGLQLCKRCCSLFRRDCNCMGGTAVMEGGLQLHRIGYNYAKGVAAMAAAIT